MGEKPASVGERGRRQQGEDKGQWPGLETGDGRLGKRSNAIKSESHWLAASGEPFCLENAINPLNVYCGRSENYKESLSGLKRIQLCTQLKRFSRDKKQRRPHLRNRSNIE